MVDFGFFREKSLFNVDDNDFLVLEKYLDVFLEHPHLLQSSRSGSLDKLYFFQDLWFLMQYGKQYKEALTEKDVTLKEVRLLFLDYLVALEEIEAAKALSVPERFIFCYRFLAELFQHSRQRIVEETALHSLRNDYYEAIDKKELTKAFQQKIITSYYTDWFKQGYILSKLFQEKLVEVKQICLAMHDLCGLMINNQEESIENFIQAILRVDDLLEITFWKKKFMQQGLSTLFEHDKDTALPTLVVCAQQSDNMRMLLNMQIGLICAILVISEEEARDFVYIPYSDKIGEELYCEKGQVMISQYLQIVQQFIGGNRAPNYRQLLNMAFTMLKLSATSSRGEIVLLCDDTIFDFVPEDDEWRQAVERYKEEMGIRIIVLYSGMLKQQISIWFADRIVFVNDFQTKMEVM